jgi:hypothetical protein
MMPPNGNRFRKSSQSHKIARIFPLSKARSNHLALHLFVVDHLDKPYQQRQAGVKDSAESTRWVGTDKGDK